MSYKQAEWTKQTDSAKATSGLNKFGENIQGLTTDLKKVVGYVDDAMAIVEKFLKTYVDPISPFLRKLKKVFSTILNDILGIGGGAILITPFNRTNKRYIQYRSSIGLVEGKYKFNELHLTTDATKSFYITVPPNEIAAMTPAEAFIEFQNSFTNKADPWRPRWTPNTITTGFGVLIAAKATDNIADFIKSLESLANFFNFSDVREAIDKYKNQFSTYAKDLDESMYKAVAQNLRGQGIVTNVTETVDVVEKGKIRKKLQASKFKLQDNLPDLHWYAFSVENIPGFRTLVDSYLAFLDWMIQVTSEVDSAIWELFNIIKKRIYTLIDLVEAVVEALASFFMLFSIGDMYTFTIEPDSGGVTHLLEAIQQSIQSPDSEAATDVAKIWTTADLSVLFFAGAGNADPDAWNLLFESLFPPDATAEEESLEYVVDGIVDRAIYPINYSYTLQFVTENNNLYFTYSVKKADGTIVNQWTDYVSNKLYGNKYAGSFIITDEGSYTLEMAAHYDNMTIDIETITYHFEVSSLVTSPIYSLQNEAPINISLIDGFDGTITLSGYDTGRIIDKSRIYGSNSASLGQMLNDSGLYQLTIVETGGISVSTLIAIDSRYPLVEMNILQSTIYLASLPSTVKFAQFANVIKIYMDSKWITINCPGYITFDAYTSYPVKYFKDGLWKEAIVTTSPIATSFRDICS